MVHYCGAEGMSRICCEGIWESPRMFKSTHSAKPCHDCTRNCLGPQLVKSQEGMLFSDSKICVVLNFYLQGKVPYLKIYIKKHIKINP